MRLALNNHTGAAQTRALPLRTRGTVCTCTIGLTSLYTTAQYVRSTADYSFKVGLSTLILTSAIAKNVCPLNTICVKLGIIYGQKEDTGDCIN